MVLQRDRPIHVWGWADQGEKVSVAMHGATGTATPDALGKWDVYLPPQPAGGPYQLTVHGNNSIVLDDILIGDVWFASGQSNMEMPLKGFNGAPLQNSAEEIANANHPGIRLLFVRHKASDYPLRETTPAGPFARLKRPRTSPPSPTSSGAKSTRGNMSRSGSSIPPGEARSPKPG
jgi:sialate O-acetylesterase